ncbi:hypothetical protein [Ramlibacter sp.]|uniref:hypothetical protein n=1 Tax=Ramlibacter sp. TaxID=1917967 RepID=UPI00262695EF|nr:hypothetical protein [Ramlibacter sp.]
MDVIVHARSSDGRGRDVLERMQFSALTLASGIRLEPQAVERGRPFRGSQRVVGSDGQARPQERCLGTSPIGSGWRQPIPGLRPSK